MTRMPDITPVDIPPVLVHFCVVATGNGSEVVGTRGNLIRVSHNLPPYPTSHEHNMLVAHLYNTK